MGIIRNAIPADVRTPGLAVEFYGSSTAMPIGLSRDRKTVYGAPGGSNTQLYQSVDDGTTWTSVRSFANRVVQGIFETDDGEALVITNGTAGSPGYIYRSSGWAASHTAATWTETLATVGGNLRPYWNGGHPWSFGDDTIRAGSSAWGVVSEYGVQTDTNGDQTSKGRRVYWTSDYGATWTQVLDIYTRYPGVYGLHCHAVAYDPYWDRIWLTYGDTVAAEGTANTQLLYSDDHGATWAPVPLPEDWVSATQPALTQSTPIAITADTILLGSDNFPGYITIPRAGYRVIGHLQVLSVTAAGTSSGLISNSLWRNRRQSGAPIIAVAQSSLASVSVPMMVSLDDGQTLQHLWDAPELRGSNYGGRTVMGPTWRGKILSWVKTSTGDMLLRGELVVPEVGLMDGSFTATGDGLTTVFTIPHGLSAAPSRYLVFPEKPASTFTVTTNATNIVVTFSAAPANGSAVQLGYRYAA